MPNRRAEIAMTEAEVAAYLRDGRTLVLVTVGPDGLPDPVPMWYVVDSDGCPVMRTYSRSQKVANLRRDPRAAGLVEDGDGYLALRGVQLTGRVELVEDADLVLDVVAGLAAKYEGAQSIDRAAARDYAAKQTVLRLVADRVVSWDHGKLA